MNMKNVNQNTEKTVCFVLLAVLITLLLIFAKTIDNYRYDIARKINSLKHQAQAEPEASLGHDLVKDIKVAAFISCPKQEGRNIFSRLEKEDFFAPVVEADDPSFNLLEVGYKPLKIKYEGRIDFNDGTIVAQVNLKNNTYLAKKGATIENYRIVKLNKAYLDLEDRFSQVTRINYRETMYGDEFIAKIVEVKSQQIFEVSENSKFLGYKVLDIDKDYVLVSKQGQHLRLEKGRVHK